MPVEHTVCLDRLAAPSHNGGRSGIARGGRASRPWRVSEGSAPAPGTRARRPRTRRCSARDAGSAPVPGTPARSLTDQPRRSSGAGSARAQGTRARRPSRTRWRRRLPPPRPRTTPWALQQHSRSQAHNRPEGVKSSFRRMWKRSRTDPRRRLRPASRRPRTRQPAWRASAHAIGRYQPGRSEPWRSWGPPSPAAFRHQIERSPGGRTHPWRALQTRRAVGHETGSVYAVGVRAFDARSGPGLTSHS